LFRNERRGSGCTKIVQEHKCCSAVVIGAVRISAYRVCAMCESEHVALIEKLTLLKAENEMLHRAVAELMADIVSLARQRGVALALPQSWLPGDGDEVWVDPDR
jgi:hypothetical protein